jgi:hypothetical protein
MLLSVFAAKLLLLICSFFVLTDSSPLVAIMTYIYDEHDILPYFLEYHSRIVGLENMAIIDNGSPEPTASILKKWEAKGLRVIQNKEHYAYKGIVTHQAYKDFFPNVKFALPLDADEFLVALDGQQKPAFPNPTEFSQRLYRLWNTPSINFRYHTMFEDCNMFGNETIETDQYFHPTWNLIKRMFKFKYLTELDHGGHHGIYPQGLSSEDNGTITDQFGLLHFHNRNLQIKLQRALKTLEGRGFLKGANLANATLSRNILEENLKHPGTQSNHKAQEIINYLKNGLDGLKEECPRDYVIKLPTVEEMIRKFRKRSIIRQKQRQPV